MNKMMLTGLVLGVWGLSVIGLESLAKEKLQECLEAVKEGKDLDARIKCGALANGWGILPSVKAGEKIWSRIKEADKAKEAAEKAAKEAARVAYLKSTIKSHWVRTSEGYEDTYCQGKGLGSYLRRYSGGTWDEMKELAGIDGCQAKDNPSRTDFCCPTLPSYLF